ncbi:Protein of unknown function, partial [Gryllus bimaculatus]
MGGVRVEFSHCKCLDVGGQVLSAEPWLLRAQVVMPRADDTEEARADFAAVQAALLLRATAAQLRAELCPDFPPPACPHNLSTWEVRERFNALLRATECPRADGVGGHGLGGGLLGGGGVGGGFRLGASGCGNLS